MRTEDMDLVILIFVVLCVIFYNLLTIDRGSNSICRFTVKCKKPRKHVKVLFNGIYDKLDNFYIERFVSDEFGRCEVEVKDCRGISEDNYTDTAIKNLLS